MRLEITRLEGRRNDLLLRLERDEIDRARLSVVNRQALMQLPGMPRHRRATPEEERGISGCKVPLAQHLQLLDVTDVSGAAQLRAVAVSNRNLGTNHGHLAWQSAETPRALRILEDPCDQASYSGLTAWSNGALSIDDLRFDFNGDRLYLGVDGRDVSAEVEWATTGQRILRGGQVVSVSELAGAFYDARHLLAFDHHREQGERIRAAIYRGYPVAFEANVRAAWRSGVPRARYVHNAIGLSDDAVIIIQREGTVEDIGEALREAGAHDGVILDNGGSVACWVWWANDYAGGMVSPTIDYRPPGTAAIAFVLEGAVRSDMPGGSVSYSVL